MRRTKSRDLSFYRHFYKYNDPEDIDTVNLAKVLHVSQQKVAGHIRSAKNNSTITEALIKQGDTPPPWFAAAEQLLKRSSSAQVPLYPAQTEEAPTSPPSIQAMPLPYRSAALSTPSALPTYNYSWEGLAPRSPTHPFVAEAAQLLKETIEDDMRRSLKDMRLRRDARRAPPRKPSLKELNAAAEIFQMRNEMEVRILWEIMRFNNILKSKNEKTNDPEEISNLFKESICEIQKQKETERRKKLETINAVGQLINTLKPRTNINIDTNRIKKELRAIEKENRKAVVEIAKTLAEHSRPRPNTDLEMMKEQNKKIIKIFGIHLMPLHIT